MRYKVEDMRGRECRAWLGVGGAGNGLRGANAGEERRRRAGAGNEGARNERQSWVYQG